MEAKPTTILAIETSCDETGLAVLRQVGDKVDILAEVVASQIDIHKETGGVVPEVAAREHTKVLRPLLRKVLRGIQGVDAIAVTVGPGLIPALSVGVTAARTLAYAWDKPIVPVHHIEGHIYSALPENPKFPALALIVSGGHTQLIEIKDHLQYNIVGTTRDDAAGEAFDKVARLLDLPYPGGPEITKLAQEGNPKAFDFPRAMLNSGDLDFSFSGLKTAVLYTLRELDHPLDKGGRGDLAASFQAAVIDALVQKTRMALRQAQGQKYASLLLAGGVAANPMLREELTELADEEKTQLNIAPLNLCADNAVMIGQVAVHAHQAGRLASWREVDAHARFSIAHWG